MIGMYKNKHLRNQLFTPPQSANYWILIKFSVLKGIFPQDSQDVLLSCATPKINFFDFFFFFFFFFFFLINVYGKNFLIFQR